MKTEYVAFYGSLMRGFGRQEELGVAEKIRFVGPCKIRGKLYDLERYPGLTAGDGVVVGELYEVRDPAVFAVTDEFEDYDPERPAESRFTRRRVRLVNPERDAWVYLVNEETRDRSEIRSGSWRDHLSEESCIPQVKSG